MKDLTKGKTFNTLLRFALPLIVAGIISQSYNLLDTIIAGKIIGTNGLSAIGSTTTFIQFLSSLFWGFGVAFAARTGEFYGAKDYKRIVTVIKTFIVFISIVMLVACGLCAIFADFILNALKVEAEIFNQAKVYFQLYMIALLIQVVSYQITDVLQSIGNSKFPMTMNIISGSLNLLLNIFFVVSFNMGVAGLAIASIISSLVGTLLGIYKIMETIKKIGGDFKFEFSFKELQSVSKLAFACILQQCSLYISSIIVQPLVNKLGKEVTAGYSIAMNVGLLLNAIFHSISRTIASYSSQALGSKQYKLFDKGIYTGLLIQAIFIVPLMIVTIAFPEVIFSVFLQDNDVSVLPYAIQYAYVCIPFTMVLAYGNLYHSFFKSVEAGKTVLLSTIIFTIARIVFTYIIPEGNYIFNVYMGLSLAWCVEAIVLGVLYYMRLWLPKDIRIELKKQKNAKA